MNQENRKMEGLKKELVLRIFKAQKKNYLTLREERALAVWFGSKGSSPPVGKARKAVKKLGKDFPEFEALLSGEKSKTMD